MRILSLTSEFPPTIGGIASHVYELTQHLARLGNDVSVFVSSREEMVPTHGVAVHQVRYRLSGWPFFELQLARWLRRRIIVDKPDIIHVHGMKPLGATRNCGVPVVFTNHSSGFLKRLDSSAFRRARTLRRLDHIAALIAPSQELLEAARTIGYAGPGHRISNGVDTDRFVPDPAARERVRSSWNTGDRPIILLARRLVAKNGVVDFAKAIAQNSDLSGDVVIAGDGPERGRMEDILRKVSVKARIRFLGAVTNDRMPEIYNAADVFVLPSHMEATSISGLEAMSCGLCVIGTRVGGIPELISDGESGVLVPPRNPVALAAVIRQMLLDAERRRRLGVAARSRVVSEFSWPGIARRTLGILREAAVR